MHHFDQIESGPIAIINVVIPNEQVEEAMQSLRNALMSIPNILDHIALSHADDKEMCVTATIKSTHADIVHAAEHIMLLTDGIRMAYPPHEKFSVEAYGTECLQGNLGSLDADTEEEEVFV